MAKKILVTRSDNDTWETFYGDGDDAQIMTITDDAYRRLCEGEEYPGTLAKDDIIKVSNVKESE
jgi:hypothetical protein